VHSTSIELALILFVLGELICLLLFDGWEVHHISIIGSVVLLSGSGGGVGRIWRYHKMG